MAGFFILNIIFLLSRITRRVFKQHLLNIPLLSANRTVHRSPSEFDYTHLTFHTSS